MHIISDEMNQLIRNVNEYSDQVMNQLEEV